MTQGLVLYDSSARIVTFNQRYIDMYNLSTDVVKPGLHYYDLIQHRKDTGSYDGDVRAFCDPIMRDVSQGKVTSTIMETPDGKSYLIFNKPLATGGWVATIEDITERRKLEQERDRNHAFLREIIDHIPTQITVKDVRDSRYVLVNSVAEEQFGRISEDIVGKTPYDLFPKHIAERVIADDDAVAAVRRHGLHRRPSLGNPHAGQPHHHLEADRDPRQGRRAPLHHQRRRGRHRPPRGRREDRASRALRRADRPAEPGAVPRAHRARAEKGGARATSSRCSTSTSTSSRASTTRSGIMSATSC